MHVNIQTETDFLTLDLTGAAAEIRERKSVSKETETKLKLRPELIDSREAEMLHNQQQTTD